MVTTNRHVTVWTYLVWLVVAGLTVSAGALLKHRAGHVPGNSIDPPYVPYTATRSNQSRDGTRTILTTFALSSSGDYIEVIKHLKRNADYRSQTVRRTVATATGLIIRIDDVAERKSTVFDPKGTNRIRVGDPRYDCMKTSEGSPLRLYDQRVVRRERLGGYDALVVRGSKTTRWHAVELNCAVLQLVSDFGNDGIVEDKFVSVSPGEPSIQLMHIPAHYAEVPPSGLDKTASAVSDDKYYYAHRPPTSLLGSSK